MTVSGSNTSIIFVESSVAKRRIFKLKIKRIKLINIIYFPIPYDIEIHKNIDKFHDQ
jgi:hypothetical protein